LDGTACLGDLLGEDDPQLEHTVDLDSVLAHWDELDADLVERTAQAIRSSISRTRSMEVCGCRNASLAAIWPSHIDGGANATWSRSNWPAQAVY
jgi:hypothetical protein